MVKAMSVVLSLAAAMALASSAAAAEKGKRLNLKPREVTGVVNINTAPASQLELLPGVGATTAKAIVAYREKTPFKSPAEIVQVKGLGEATYRRIKPHLAVSGPSTLALARAQAKTPPARPASK